MATCPAAGEFIPAARSEQGSIWICVVLLSAAFGHLFPVCMGENCPWAAPGCAGRKWGGWESPPGLHCPPWGRDAAAARSLQQAHGGADRP